MEFRISKNKQELVLTKGDELEQIQLELYFKKRIDNYRFHPLVKKGLWDGNINFINKNRLSIGLWKELYHMCKKYNYPLKVTGLKTYLGANNFDPSEYIEWEQEYFEDMSKKPRYYQTDTVVKFLKWKRSIAELATSAGKTMIIFNLFAFLKSKGYLKGQFLIIVPNISLVLQTLESFLELSKDKTKLQFTYQTIGGGNNKYNPEVDLVIGTFQTLRSLDEKLLSRVQVALVDEVHTAASKSVKTVLTKCRKALFRCGLSGTTLIEKGNTDSFTLQSYIGPLVHKVSAKELTDGGYATKVNIVQLRLNYLEEEKRIELWRAFQNEQVDNASVLKLEKKIITTSEVRFRFLIDFAKRLKSNSLILFQDVAGSYGHRIQNQLEQELDSKKYEILYVSGEIDKNTRERYRKLLNQKDKIRVMVASFGTFSVGIDVNNIHNIVFAESYKSEKIIKQSIGRGMRLDSNKDQVTIYDFVDDFRYNNSKNFVFRHGETRRHIYKQEGHELLVMKINLYDHESIDKILNMGAKKEKKLF